MPLISPKTPPGVMELLPRDQIAFQAMLDTIRGGFERFGFLPIETPVFETTDVLLTKSGGETEKQVYFCQSTGSRAQGREPDLALRFDLTVPLARYVAEHERDLPFPFRRYQIQRVYRGERAQKGRYREFYQCDIDVIGKDSLPVTVDAELPAVIHHVFTALKIGGFIININNRKVLRGVLDDLEVTRAERQALVLREIDKLDKIGPEKVRDGLTGGDCALSPAAAERMLALAAAGSGGAEPAIKRAGDQPAGLRGAAATLVDLGSLGVDSDAFRQGLAELEAVVQTLDALGVPPDGYRINPAIARGLDYYTGTVYETFLTDHPGLGSVCSGGRYDDLASHYTKSRLPGVGISIGATRLFYQLRAAGVFGPGASTAQVLVTQLDPALTRDCLAVAATLRAAGLNTETVAEPAKMARQMKYADRAGIPVAVMIGPDEKIAGTVTVKDLATGTQTTVPRDALVQTLRGILQPS